MVKGILMLDLRKAIEFKRHRLDNGLDLVIIPLDRIPVVCVNIAYKVGSKDESIDNTGFAHLFEHLMFEGSKNVQKGEFDNLCSVAGGTNNAYTTYDLTSYTMSLPSHQLELGLWLESDRLFNFEVTEEALLNQKKVVVEEIRQTVENQPYGRWRELLAELAFKPECSYSWEVHGKIEHVESAQLENTQSFFDRFYNPSNACLVLCGDVNETTALPLVEKYFNRSRKINQPVRNEFAESFRLKGKSGTFEDSIPLSGVFISFHFDGFNSDDTFTADLLANISGDGKSSRLYRSLVYDKQIASQAGAFADKRENSSVLTFYAIANKANTSCDQLYEALIAELDNIKKIRY